jgi:hypothetical protein
MSTNTTLSHLFNEHMLPTLIPTYTIFSTGHHFQNHTFLLFSHYEGLVLLGYDAESMGSRIPKFRGNIVSTSSKGVFSIWRWGHFFALKRRGLITHWSSFICKMNRFLSTRPETSFPTLRFSIHMVCLLLQLHTNSKSKFIKHTGTKVLKF